MKHVLFVISLVMTTVVGFTNGNEFTLEGSHGISAINSEEETYGNSATDVPPPPGPPPSRPSLPTTTTTERIPLPFEKFTKELIRANNASIELVQLNLARYETQLNLNALNTLLPKLKQLRQNMTNLLASPSPNYRTFETQSTSLGEKLTEVELQINKNRALLQRYEDSERDTQKHLGIMYKSLGNILLSQVNILSGNSDVLEPIGTEPIIRTEIEMRSFLEDAFVNYRESDIGGTGSEIQLYLKSLNNPDNRIFAYNLTLQLIKLHGARKDTLFVQMAKNIFKLAELTPLKTLLPARVTNVFSDESKLIEMRTLNRQIIIRTTDGRVEADRAGRLITRVWKFVPLNNSEYFAIVHSQLSKALGFSASGDPLRNNASTMPYINVDSIKSNHFYHWTIIAYYNTANSNYFAKFINRQTGLALDVNSSFEVIGQKAQNISNQDWEVIVA